MEIFIATMVVLLDWWSKEWVKKNLILGVSRKFIPRILNFHYTRNSGAAFSILTGQRWLLSGLALVAILFMLIYRNRIIDGKIMMKVVYGLILGGTIGNVIDRLRYGYVIDFLEFSFVRFPIFNIADSALTLGVGLVLILLLQELIREGFDGTKHRS